MENTHVVRPVVAMADTTYEAPKLTLIGAAGTVIMGMPGGGFDGAYGITEPPFEFESDDLD